MDYWTVRRFFYAQRFSFCLSISSVVSHFFSCYLFVSSRLASFLLPDRLLLNRTQPYRCIVSYYFVNIISFHAQPLKL